MITKIKFPNTSTPSSVSGMKKNGKDVLYLKRNGVTYYTKHFKVTTNLTGVSLATYNTPEYKRPLSLSFVPDTGLQLLPSTVRVTMGGVDITNTAFDFETRKVTLASVTGNVTIEAIGAEVDAEVEWIQSNNSAYIDTGIVPTSRNFVIELNFQWIGNVATDFETFIGFMAASTMPRSGFHKYNGKWMHGTNVTSDTGIVVDNDKHTIKIIGDARNNKETLYIDGNVITEATTNSQGIANNSLSYYISARHRSNTIDNPSFMRIGYVKIYYPTDTLVRDYVPVRNNGVGYLYDKVSGELFGNANSSGSFTYGNDKT